MRDPESGGAASLKSMVDLRDAVPPGSPSAQPSQILEEADADSKDAGPDSSCISIRR
jgi:hypothetical protein